MLVSLRNFTKFMRALLDKNPKPLVYTNRELISFGLSLSYIITYLHQL